MPTTGSRKSKSLSPAWERWHKEVETFENLIERYADEPSPHGQKWTDRMLAYWRRRLDELSFEEPPKYEE